MGAPKGNEFWKARSSHGRKPKFESPEVLAKLCEEYFQWVEDNPLKEEKVFCFQGEITRTHVTKMRAMTIMGLCNFLDINQSTWFDYRHKDGFSEVITRAEQTIRQQKFEGAAAEFLDSRIIARDLGLTDKRETHLGAEEGLLRALEQSKQLKVVGVKSDGDSD